LAVCYNIYVLHAHMWDEGTQSYSRRECWGVRNGWAAAGLVRVIRALPDSMTIEKTRLIG
jgi:unsaturated rhamnogalacturonyl hydrolase